jgi:hypothetical protein
MGMGLPGNGSQHLWATVDAAGAKRGNWIERPCPTRVFFPMLRLYSPLEPFFTKAWRPSEVELVR